MRARLLVLLALGAGAAVVSGCGSSGNDTQTTTTRTVVRTVRAPDNTTTQTPGSGVSGVGDGVTAGIAGGAVGATGATTTVANDDDPVESIGSTTASGIMRPFAANSPWNTTIQGLDVDPDSNRMMRLARQRVGAAETANGTQVAATRERTFNDPLFINLHRWTTPVVDEVGGVTTPTVCRQPPLPPKVDLCGDGWTVSSLSVPHRRRPASGVRRLVHGPQPPLGLRLRPLARAARWRRHHALLPVHAPLGPQRPGLPAARHASAPAAPGCRCSPG